MLLKQKQSNDFNSIQFGNFVKSSFAPQKVPFYLMVPRLVFRRAIQRTFLATRYRNTKKGTILLGQVAEVKNLRLK